MNKCVICKKEIEVFLCEECRNEMVKRGEIHENKIEDLEIFGVEFSNFNIDSEKAHNLRDKINRAWEKIFYEKISN